MSQIEDGEPAAGNPSAWATYWRTTLHLFASGPARALWALLLVVAFLIVVSVVGTLTSESATDVHQWTAAAATPTTFVPPSTAPEALGQRMLRVTRTNGSLVVTGQIDLPTDSPVLHALLASTGANTTNDFSDAVVGTVTVRQWKMWPGRSYESERLIWTTRSVTRATDSGDFTIQVQTAPYVWLLPQLEMNWQPAVAQVAPSDNEVLVTGTGWRAILPSNLSASDAQHIEMTGEQLGHATTQTTVVDDVPAAPLSLVLQRETGQVVTDHIRGIGSVDLEVGGYPLYYLVTATLPLALLLAALCGFASLRSVAAAAAVKRIVTALVTLSAAIAAFWLLYDVTGHLPHDVWDQIAGHLRDPGHRVYAGGRQIGINLVFITAVAIGWPLVSMALLRRLVRGGDNVPPPGRSPRAGEWLVVVVVAGIVGEAAWFTLPHLTVAGSHALATVEIVAGYATLLGLLWLLAWVTRLGLRFPLLLSAVAAGALVLLGFLLSPLTGAQTGRLEVGTRMAYAMMCVVILVGYAALVVAAIVLSIPWQRARKPRRWAMVAAPASVIFIFAATLPTVLRSATSRQQNSVLIASPLYLATALDSFSYLLLLLLIVHLMHQVALLEPGDTRLRAKRVLAGLFAVEVMYSFTDRWAYIPVTVVIGIGVVALFTLPVRRLSRISQGLSDGDWDTAMKSFVDQPAKASPAKRPKGGRVRTTVATTHRPRTSDERIRLFGFSREGDSWRDAGAGTVVGFVIGLPLTVILGLRYVGGSVSASYSTLYFVSSELPTLLQGALFGFLMGYAYAFIRGSNGISKALTLLLTRLVPTVPLLLLWGSHTAITRYWIYCLGLLGFFLVLGVAIGIVGLLSRAHIDLASAFDLYRLRGLVAWGTATSVTIVTAFVTALGSAASGVATADLVHTSSATQNTAQSPSK